MSITLVLKEGREKSLLRRHPWIFSGAVGQLKGPAKPGDTVMVRSAAGKFLAWAACSPASQIRARVWSFLEQERPDEAFLRERVRQAVVRRAHLAADSDAAKDGHAVKDGNAMRLVHAEADGLPGLIADRYADVLVVQITAAGAERWRDVLVDELRAASGCAQVYERSDADVRALEGLAPRTGALAGMVPPGPVHITEHGLRYAVDVVAGQKTGFFLDQRDNRLTVGAQCRDREVLNCFCYTGGFTLSALAAGARSVTSVDSSAPALEAARANVTLNALDAAGSNRAQWVEADVFRYLRQLRGEGRQFDLIVLDPPKFAPTSKDAERAARGYKDINLHALQLLRPGGKLATFSCSSGVNADLFQKIVAGAAADAGVSCSIDQRFHAAADHPVLLEFPEGEYLKGLLLTRR
jgi:23S rRNA (cytosine1962-C5)-methyltransferase